MQLTIWTYWHQGFQYAPNVVKRCVEQLQKLHPDYTIHLLDAENIYNFADPVPIPESKWKKLCLPHQSDLLRTQLLIRHGGIWLDPTVFCIKPLDSWLPGLMEQGLFLFHRPGKDRIISNWFIAAEQNNYLLQQLYQALIDYWNRYNFRNLGSQPPGQIEYWSNRIINGRSLLLSQLWLSPIFTNVLRLYPYMIYHYMLYHLIRSEPECSRIYEDMPKVSADGPVFIKRQGFASKLTPHLKQKIKGTKAPLFKLDWKTPIDHLPDDSLIHSLLNNRLIT